jgi:hypothetical protein
MTALGFWRGVGMGGQSDGEREFSRRAFIKTSAGVATGAAVVGAPAAVVLSGEQRGAVIRPSGPAPRETVMAYVHDAERGEVTVLSGTQETTYRDPVLVERLLAAAAPHQSIVIGGGVDVLAP